MGWDRAWWELLSRPVKSARSALLLGLSAFCTAAEAHAHDVPYAVGFAWRQPEADALPVVLSNRGLIFASADGSAKLRVRCNEAYGANTAVEPLLLSDPSGVLSIATDSQVQTSSDEACTFTKSVGLPMRPLLSGVTDPAASNRVLITTADYENGSALFASEDYGKSWLLRSALPPATSYRKLVYGSAGWIYARGSHYDAAARQLIGIWALSRDHGASFHEQTLASDREPLGVHPQNPALVFAREPLSSALGEYPDRLLRSEDSGQSFQVVRELPHITAFAATPDGAIFWLGTQTAGLFRSTDGGLHFERTLVGTIESVHTLAYRQERLWLGATGASNHEAVWVSSDRGTSVRPVLRLDSIANAVSCRAPADAVCEASYQHLREELESIPTSDEATTPGIRIDTSDVKVAEPTPVPEPPAMAPRDEGDGCATHANATGRSAAVWFVCLLMAARGRRLRSPRSR